MENIHVFIIRSLKMNVWMLFLYWDKICLNLTHKGNLIMNTKLKAFRAILIE